MKSFTLFIFLAFSLLNASEAKLQFDKAVTKVFMMGKKNLAAELIQDTSLTTVIEVTGSKLTRYKVCQKNGSTIECTTYSSGGKLIQSIDTFDAADVSKVNGPYLQYYTAYIGNRNKYNCPFVVWDEDKAAFVSEDDRPICNDELRLKYKGAYQNGQKVGEWETYDKEGKLTKTQKYKYSKLRESAK